MKSQPWETLSGAANSPSYSITSCPALLCGVVGILFFILCILWCFDVLKTPSGWGETAPPWESQFWKRAKEPGAGRGSANGPGQSRASCLWPGSPRRNHSRARCQARKDHPVAQCPLKLLSQPTPNYPALSCLCHRNPSKGSGLDLSLAPASGSWPKPGLPVALHGEMCLMFLWKPQATVNATLCQWHWPLCVSLRHLHKLRPGCGSSLNHWVHTCHFPTF